MRYPATIKRIGKTVLTRLGLYAPRPRRDSKHSFNHTFQRLRLLRDLGFNPETILDVGASSGIWTRKSLPVFPAAKYYCIEPLREHSSELKSLTTEVPNVSFRQCLLGSTAGQATINADGDGSSVLNGHWDNPYGEVRRAEMTTIDRLVEEKWMPTPSLIKLDVQGYELEVLKGGPRALESATAVICETSFFAFQSGMPIVDEVIAFMRRHEFVCHDILSLAGRPLDGATAQADLLFLRAMDPLRKNHCWAVDSTY